MIGPERPARPPDMTTSTKVRLRFGKRGDLRLVSHHDLMRCLERMLRRARVPMAMTRGFNPRPKMTFALALGLGIEALREVVDLELTEPWVPSELLGRLEACAPPGFAWVDAQPLSPGAAAPRPRSVAYEMPVPEDRREAARAAAMALVSSASWPVVRRRADREREIDLRPHVLSAALADDGVLRFRLAVPPDGSARPEDVLDALSLRDLLEDGAFLTRVDVEIEA
jgi:radical SAM-linked protein